MLLPSIFGENLFDDWMDFSFPEIPDVDKTLYGKHAKNMMKTDVKETEKGYEVAVDLPGFKKDEIQLELNDGYLTISAEKGLDKEEKDKKDKYIRRERYAGSMTLLLCRRECYRKRYPRKIRKWYFNTGCPEGRSKESSGKTIHIH